MFVNGQYRPIFHSSSRTSPFDNTTIRRKNGNIILNAGRGNDAIDVRKVGGGLYNVNVNGTNHQFTSSEMRRLVIKGGKGDDRINIDRSVDIPIRVQGNKGNDTISNYADGTHIDGGKHGDAIINRANGAVINGGKGHDAIDSVGSFNTLRGNRGNDTINSQGHSNNISGGRHADTINSMGHGNVVRGNRGNDRIQSFGNGNDVNGNRGWDDVWSAGAGNRVRGGRGWDRVVNNGFPWNNSLGCFGGWDNMGNLGYNAGYAHGYHDGLNNGYQLGNILGGFPWGGLAAVGAAAWGVDMTANLLGSLFRC